MTYFIDISSPATWNAFLNSQRNVSGATAKKIVYKQIHPGDIFICYLTGLSRWCGVLEVTSEPYHADTGLYNTEDPYVIRFDVNPVVCLLPEQSIPIKDSEVWPNLSFTKKLNQNSSAWTSLLRKSHSVLSSADGEFLYTLLKRQSSEQRPYPLTAKDKRRWRRGTNQIAIELPAPPAAPAIDGIHHPTAASDEPAEQTPDVRDSIRMQAKVAKIGATMGFSIWVPANDKARVFEQLPESTHDKFLGELKLGYDPTTLGTIRNIDVLWLKGNAIVRAFEIEHTTAVYSGLLRMADLLALQPNIDIKLHIVADNDKQSKVLREIKRPAFNELGLVSKCSFLSYSAIDEISSLAYLEHTTHSVVGKYEILA